MDATSVGQDTAWHEPENEVIIETLLDACQLVLEEQGPLSSYWLASQVVEMKLWRASEADVRDALTRDIDRLGDRSRFVHVGEDEFALRSRVETRGG